MKTTAYSYYFVFIILCVCAGCERAELLEVSNEATLSNIQATIFDTNCALSGCHAGSDAQLDQNLSAGQSFSNIVNVRSVERSDLFRVEPGNPDDSYLFMKIIGDPDIVGARMPLGRAALSDQQIEIVREWIANGAEDN